jgi:hypothetical protein
MDNFKETAEIKMREAVEKQVQGEIDVDESEYKTRQEEFKELQNLDTKAEKRQMWMQSISGQDRNQPMTLPDPSTLGAKTSALGATAGRPLRGVLGGLNQETKAGIGLSGMRAPKSSAKPLIPTSPLVRPIKSPLASSQPTTSAILPKPIMKLGTPAIQPVIEEELQPESVTEELGVVADNQETTTLAPITRTMVPVEQVQSNVVKLTPVKHMLTPVKRQILESDE